MQSKISRIRYFKDNLSSSGIILMRIIWTENELWAEELTSNGWEDADDILQIISGGSYQPDEIEETEAEEIAKQKGFSLKVYFPKKTID